MRTLSPSGLGKRCVNELVFLSFRQSGLALCSCRDVHVYDQVAAILESTDNDRATSVRDSLQGGSVERLKDKDSLDKLAHVAFIARL